ncbi:hypothetical protein QFZ22_008552 [Streptomyces canus]|uniref:Uncharacterized protein n=1 Tax=Streptomyces canus TaxID=58343 RepID=A0AAW8FS00_9ACTN|nr:hypothetical protein [Streptomyces canus]
MTLSFIRWCTPGVVTYVSATLLYASGVVPLAPRFPGAIRTRNRPGIEPAIVAGAEQAETGSPSDEAFNGECK